MIPFSMQDDRNTPNQYSDYFIENIDYKKLNKDRNISSAIKVLKKSIYSTEAIEKLEKLLLSTKIDLAHLNLIHHYITPAILKLLKKHKIPVIWTLHDYTILCPQSTFISNDKICEECRGGNFYHCAINKCKKGSFLASSLAAFENYVHKHLNYYEYVDYFICPSAFSYNKYKDFGFFPDKLKQIYHSYTFDDVIVKTVEGSTRYIVYVGRLEKIKGVHTLLEAMAQNPNIGLKIIGDGNEETTLKLLKENKQINNVEFLGKLPKTEVLTIIKKSEFLVCPSEWYEVLGFTIFEAMLMGKPVVGANIGAIPETVIHEHTGLLFRSGDINDLSEKISALYYSTNLLNMGNNAKAHIKSIVDPEKHLLSMKSLIPEL